MYGCVLVFECGACVRTASVGGRGEGRAAEGWLRKYGRSEGVRPEERMATLGFGFGEGVWRG